MLNTQKKVIAVTAAAIAFLGLQGYGYLSMKQSLEDRIGLLEEAIQEVRDSSTISLAQVAADIGVVTEKMGVTEKDLEQAREQARRAAELLRQEHAKTAARLQEEWASSSKALREEASTRLNEVQNETSTKIGAVSSEVQTVKGDLDATKSDLAASRREMGDLRDSLGREIARNSSELAELKRRGERDYIEFDVAKGKNMQRLADIQVQLKKADAKSKKYDIVLMVDDAKMEKKGQPVNEPIQFLVGRDRLRYEMVVFAVDKDRIRGYLSTPKRGLVAEGPSFRQ